MKSDATPETPFSAHLRSSRMAIDLRRNEAADLVDRLTDSLTATTNELERVLNARGFRDDPRVLQARAVIALAHSEGWW